jgi:hypothetical protein
VDLLVMPLETPLETVRAAAQIAKERGARVILNPAPACDLDCRWFKRPALPARRRRSPSPGPARNRRCPIAAKWIIS